MVVDGRLFLMVRRTLNDALAGHKDERVVLRGWVHRRRRLSAVSFLILRDRSGLAQVVVSDDATKAQLDALPEETVVEVEGTVTANDKAPGGVEVTAPSMTATLPVLLDHAPVLWRHPAQAAYWRLAAASLRGFRRTLDEQGFTEILTPKIVVSSTESGANLFSLDSFAPKAFLIHS